ncbi:hypothetical protein KCU83_g630, partial [Aureobasidium melanogenum]
LIFIYIESRKIKTTKSFLPVTLTLFCAQSALCIYILLSKLGGTVIWCLEGVAFRLAESCGDTYREGHMKSRQGKCDVLRKQWFDHFAARCLLQSDDDVFLYDHTVFREYVASSSPNSVATTRSSDLPASNNSNMDVKSFPFEAARTQTTGRSPARLHTVFASTVADSTLCAPSRRAGDLPLRRSVDEHVLHRLYWMHVLRQNLPCLSSARSVLHRLQMQAEECALSLLRRSLPEQADVGGVETTTHTDFDNANIHILQREYLESSRGKQFEFCCLDVLGYVARQNLCFDLPEDCFRYCFFVNSDAIPAIYQMWRTCQKAKYSSQTKLDHDESTRENEQCSGCRRIGRPAIINRSASTPSQLRALKTKHSSHDFLSCSSAARQGVAGPLLCEPGRDAHGWLKRFHVVSQRPLHAAILYSLLLELLHDVFKDSDLRQANRRRDGQWSIGTGRRGRFRLKFARRQ